MAIPVAKRAASSCEVKNGLFGGCHAPLAGRCQYCGRGFCAAHGELHDDGQEICARKRCRQKKADIAVHLEYKALVARRNAAGICGHDGCETRYGGQCSKCRGFFCMAHVHPRDETVRKGMATVTRMAAMCDHCWRRRPLWSRT